MAGETGERQPGFIDDLFKLSKVSSPTDWGPKKHKQA
jgi:hypothetical protein